MVVHHHAIVIASVQRKPREINLSSLRAFLSNLVDEIRMEKLFEPIAVHGKYGYTGIAGIVTSHIAFHYFETEQVLHLDVYSCKEYNLNTLMEFLDDYWKIRKADVIFLERDKGPKLKQHRYEERKLTEKVT